MLDARAAIAAVGTTVDHHTGLVCSAAAGVAIAIDSVVEDIAQLVEFVALVESGCTAVVVLAVAGIDSAAVLAVQGVVAEVGQLVQIGFVAAAAGEIDLFPGALAAVLALAV